MLADTLPYGPQHNISESQLLADGWVRVFYQPYSNHTSDASLFNALAGYGPGDEVLLGGCLSADCSNIYLGAAAPYEEVFHVTDNTAPSTKSHAVNGSYWYYIPGNSIGFAPNSDVYLWQADTRTSSGDLRLSWHLLGWVGGYRVGNYRSNSSTVWRKVVYARSGQPIDTDGDGIPDGEDGCPTDPYKIEPGQCGCGVADTDNDGDGLAACWDECDSDPAKTEAGLCGCGYADACLLNGACLAEGEATCDGDASSATCTNGALVVVACGTDFCNDSGDAFGGGACNAVDYFCQDGACGSTASSGEDMCAGSADAPALTYYSCVGGNQCVAESIVAQDSCADDGTSMGGGSCTATDWVCDGTNTFYVEQGEMKVPLTALHGDKTVAQFYSYGNPIGSSSNAGEETSNRGNIYLYYDDVNSLFSLVVVLDKGNDGSGGQVNMTIDGLAGSGSVIAVKDDPGDSYNLSTGKFVWNWAPCCTDGMALQLAGDSACLTFTPTYVVGINEWAVVSHNPDGTRTETIMPGAVTDSFTVCTTSSLHKKVSAGTDSCGGDAGSPSVEYFTCQASDGTVADRCVAATTTQTDTCSDTGSNYGGGSCSATDWSCDGGLLSSTSSSGTDACGGTPDAPSVAYYVCQDNNACVAEETVESDLCTDGGTQFGGGSCAAVDWTCTNGILASTASNGDDVCFGTADVPGVKYFTCEAGDGKVADTCVQAENQVADGCFDSGSALGGGSCQASDWTCADGLLSGVETAGIDTCGGTGEAPNVTYWTCQAFDGMAPDRCVAALTEQGDTCVDTGTVFGGGSCAATDWTCQAGTLSSSTTSGTDTCYNNADAPYAKYFTCLNGNTCVADSTLRADSCTDTGGAYGGGSCSATNWFCNGTTLTSTASSGTDTCGGTAANPSVEYWVCINGDGIESDVCEPRNTTEADSCADTGDEYGAGWCTANDWTCENGALTVDATEGVDTCGGTADEPTIGYFVCQNNNACVPAETAEFDSCADGGDVYGGGSCAATDWACSDVFIGDLLAVNFGFETGDFTGWNRNGELNRIQIVTGHTGVSGTPYTATDGDRFLRLTAGCPGNPSEVWQEIYMGAGQVITGSAAFDAGDYIPFNDSAIVVFKANGQQVAVPYYANVSTVGSYADGPWVEWEFTAPEAGDYLILYSVVNMSDCSYTSYGLFDGPEYTCTDADGDGQCDSPAYAGYLDSNGTAGTDKCNGTPDAPGVEYWVCSTGDGDVADACVAQVKTEYDSCTDSGSGFGGGACSAVDWDCTDGVLASTGNSGTDTCGGTEDAPTVDFWACTAGDGMVADLCVVDTTSQFDSCVDSGNGYGGGACSAVDWDCNDGLLAATGNAGNDTCGGTADAPNVEFWSCYAGDGTVADFCVAGLTTENDSCSDNGTGLGGGACSATDWDCADGVLAFNGTSGTDTCGGTEDAPAVDFWTCNAQDGTVADRCVVDTTVQFDACSDSGDAYGGGSCAAIDWDCTGGLLASSGSEGTDTCGGNDDAPNVEYWVCTAGDGVVGDLCTSAVTSETDLCSDSGTNYGGGTCSATDWDCNGGVLASTSNAGVDTCGGTEDAPAVEYWVCSAGDGTLNDLCTPAVTSENDGCTDSGDMWGGGVCSAQDWDCDSGLLALDESAGTDVCGGTVDAPNVTFWSCNASDGAVVDRCLSELTERQDVCSDTGTPSGGGTCNATDWTCNNAVLSSTSNDGVDTCGDGSDNQTYYYVCDAADGAVNDLCVQVPDETPPEVGVVLAEQAVLDDGLIVYQVYCDVTDVCDDNPEYSSLVETPSPDGLDTRLKTNGVHSIKFNLNNSKLDIVAPLPEEVLADLYDGGIPIEDGQSVTIKTHAGETYHYTYKVQEGIALIELKGPWVRIWCYGQDDAGHESQGYWEEEFHAQCGCRCQCDCPANGECACNCNCEDAECGCDCTADGDCTCTNPNGDVEEPEAPADNGNPGKGGGKK